MLKRLAALCLVLAGCASSPTDPTPLDPVGQWNIVGTYGTGSCGATGTFTEVDTVEGVEPTYTLTSNAMPTSISGTIICNPDSCEMSATEDTAGTSNGIAYQGSANFNYVLMADGAISGNGQVHVTFSGGSPAPCSQAFTVTGTKN